jgi:hypothetical protein
MHSIWNKIKNIKLQVFEAHSMYGGCDVFLLSASRSANNSFIKLNNTILVLHINSQ